MDCTNANTGLFTGIFVLVVTIISLVIFLVLIHSPRPELHDAAIAVASVTEFSLYTLTTVAALVGICQVSTFPSSYFRAFSDLSLRLYKAKKRILRHSGENKEIELDEGDRISSLKMMK